MNWNTLTWKVARKINDSVVLDNLGWNISIPLFRGCRIAALICILCSSSLISTLLFSYITIELGEHRALISTVLFSLYMPIAYSIKELFSIRTVYLTMHPLRNFYKTLGIPRVQVVCAESMDKIVLSLMVTGGWCYSAAIQEIFLESDVVAAVILFIFPFLICLLELLVTLSVATREKIRGNKKYSLLYFVLIALCIIGIVELGSSYRGMKSWYIYSLNVFLILTVTVLSMCLVLVLSVSRLLSEIDFSLNNEVWNSNDAILRHSQNLILHWTRIISKDLFDPWRIGYFSHLICVAWLLLFALLGAKTFLPINMIMVSSSMIIDQLSAVIVFGITITSSEVIINRVGSYALLYQNRFVWEMGEHAVLVSLVPILIAAVICLPIVIPIAVISSILGGHWLIVMSVECCVLSSSWIASAILSDGTKFPDGSITSSMSTGIVSVIISSASIALLLYCSQLSMPILEVVISLILFGGAIWAGVNRVLYLPLK
ncbi:hypothetical protein [Galliscardovia ingluviei]|uniref:hypothetical protein n=1 Tax=Galliscardovia ingluviei TaxID=1769422 RepID=UPI00166304B7|nr:hypothetical protein [Galliscardovia ingluviei]